MSLLIYAGQKNMERPPFVILVQYGKTSTKNISVVLNYLWVRYAAILPGDNPPNIDYTHIILSGGPNHVYHDEHCCLPDWIIETDKPVFGVCFGMQLIARLFGGKVERMSKLEKGHVIIKATKRQRKGTKLQEIPIKQGWMNRYDRITRVPGALEITEVTNKGHIASFTDGKKWWGVQYHPESPECVDLECFRKFLGLRFMDKNVPLEYPPVL